MNDLEDLKNEDQLLTMMEEMQDQIEELQNQVQEQSQKNSEAQKTISKISSENLILRKKLQEKSERIEKMNESDLIVKKNEELEKKNKQLQENERKAREEAETEVEAVKRKAIQDVEAAQSRYNERVDSLSSREITVERRESAVSVRESNVNTEINTKAEKLVKDKISSLEIQYDNKKFALKRQYKNDNSRMINQHKKRMKELEAKYHTMVAGYRGIVFFTLFYSIITTVITATNTDALVKDFQAFYKTIYRGIAILVGWISVAANFVAKLGDMIPQAIVSAIVHWLLVGIVYAVIGGAIGWLLFLLGKKYVGFFKEKQADEISVFVVLITLAITVFMADWIKSILSINLIGLMLLLFVGYTVIRGIVQAENTEAKQKIVKYVVITGAGIGVWAVMVHFIGGIALVAVPIGCLVAWMER